MNIRVDTINNCVIIRIKGTIDETLHDKVSQILRQGNPRIVINMESVNGWSRKNFANMLLQIKDECFSQGGDLVIANPPNDNDLLVELYKHYQLKKVSSLSEATDYFSQDPNQNNKALERIRENQRSNTRSIVLAHLHLRSVPEEIKQLSELEILYLDHNQLEGFPLEILRLTKLETLELSANRIKSISPEIIQLSNLRRLELGENLLKDLPIELGQLKELYDLTIRSNQFTHLPPVIFTLTNLRELNVANNQITEIPKEIRHLKNLSRLDIRGNRLTSLPDEIGELTNLRYFSANDNLEVLKFPI